MRWRRIPLRDPSAPVLLGRLGMLNPGLAYALSLLGLAHISASLSVLLWALEPILILVLAAWFLSERVGWIVLALSAVAVSGMLLVAYQPGTAGNALGVALTVAGVLCCAIYTVVTRRWIGASDGTAPVVVSQQAHALGFGLVVVTILWLLGGAVRPGAVRRWAGQVPRLRRPTTALPTGSTFGTAERPRFTRGGVVLPRACVLACRVSRSSASGSNLSDGWEWPSSTIAVIAILRRNPSPRGRMSDLAPLERGPSVS